jgi:hypothetical protein
VKIIIAAVIGAVLAMSGERLANTSDPGVASAAEALAPQESILIEAPSRPQVPVFDFNPPAEE